MLEKMIKATQALQRSVTCQSGYQYKYIDPKDGCPRVDLEKKILYVPVFGYLNVEDDKLVRYFNIHELAHIKYTGGNKDKSWSKLLGHVVNILEDNRVERAISCDEPGIASIVMDGHVEAIKRYVGKIDEMENPVMRALFALHFEEYGYFHTSLDSASRVIYELIEKKFKSWRNLPNSLNRDGYYEVIELAKEICELIKDYSDSSDDSQEDNSEDQDDNSSESSEDQEDSSSESSEDQEDSSSESSEDQEDSSSESSEDQEDSSSESSEDQEDSSSESSKKVDVKLEKALKEIESDNVDTLEDMINESMKDISNAVKSESYIPYTNEDIVETVKETSCDDYNKSYKKINSKLRRLQMILEHVLKSKKRSYKMSNLEHGKFDIRKSYRLLKSTSNQVFYKKHEGIDLNTSVSLLIDESGSMNGYDKIDMARALSIAFGETLDKLGVPFEIIGFTTNEWEGKEINPFNRTIQLKHEIFKNFSEKYQVIKTRLGMIDSQKHNVDGEAVKFACDRLQSRKELRKVLFVLSDGCPECRQLSRSTLSENLKTVLKKYRSEGIEIYSFGIMSQEPVELYGEEYSVYVPSIENLGEEFFKKMSDVLDVK